MLLNLGCGPHRAPSPWLNVDTWDQDGNSPDITANLLDLPFEHDSASMVYMGHVLEHIAPDDVPLALAEAARVLEPGGRICVVGPDCDRIDPARYPTLYQAAVDGGGMGANPHGPHLWRAAEVNTLAFVRGAFPDAYAYPVEHVPDEWPIVAREFWQCAIEATK